ncbi:MAG: type II secretion system protein N [Rhodoferax sp.]|nr:type II secretion system protein N [Rhodoferax sp.]
MTAASPLPPQRTPWAWAVFGALFGLIGATLWFAPAQWLARLVATQSSARVLLGDARGTVWHGSAQLILSGGTGSQSASRLPDRLEWTMRPSWRGLDLSVHAPCCMPSPWRMQAAPRWAGLTLRMEDHPTQWPAELLIGLGTPWNTVQAHGTLLVSTRGLALLWIDGRLTVTGGAQVDAQDMSSRLSTLRPMGSYRLTLEGGSPTVLRLSTLDGSLQLSGSGQWVGSRLRFEGEASAAPDRLDALSNLLNILGRRDGARAIIKVG